MENPFRYGSVVTGKDFVGREKEFKTILREIRNGQRILLYSQRRMGKSSLLQELARRNHDEFIFAYVDLYGITSRNKLLESIVTAVANAAYTKVEKLGSLVKELTGMVQFRFVITREGNLGIELDRRDVPTSELDVILDFPEKIGKKKGKQVVVLFDEFQEVAKLDGVSILKRMRSRMQMHKNSTYIFSGSKRHMLLQIFEEAEGAFYKSAVPIELGPIHRQDFENFITEKFEAAGGSIRSSYVKRIVDASGGYPYYVQQIAHELFDRTVSPSDSDEIEEAIQTAVDHHAPYCQTLWDSIKSSLQRQYLLAVAAEPGVSHGTSFIEKYGLRSYSHIQRIEKQLVVRGVIEDGDIVDPMFALWLRRIKRTG